MKFPSRLALSLAAAGAVGASLLAPAAASAAQAPSSVTGDAAVERAAVWSDNNVGYSQGSTYHGYRTDCSGYLSRAWGLDKPGLQGHEFFDYGHAVSKGDLKRGDALIKSDGGHITMFDKWTNSSHNSYWAYEESSTKGAVHREIPYPYFSGEGTYKPLRYDGLK